MITKLLCLAIPVVCFGTQNGGLSTRDLVEKALNGQPPTLPPIVPMRGQWAIYILNNWLCLQYQHQYQKFFALSTGNQPAKKQKILGKSEKILRPSEIRTHDSCSTKPAQPTLQCTPCHQLLPKPKHFVITQLPKPNPHQLLASLAAQCSVIVCTYFTIQLQIPAPEALLVLQALNLGYSRHSIIKLSIFYPIIAPQQILPAKKFPSPSSCIQSAQPQLPYVERGLGTRVKPYLAETMSNRENFHPPKERIDYY